MPKNLSGIKLYTVYIHWTRHVLSESATVQWILGSPRGQTVSPSAQKELEDSCSQPVHTDRNSDKHEDLNPHRTQEWPLYQAFNHQA